jgi:PKD repeat protein
MYLYAGSPDYVSTPSLSDNVPTVGVANTVYDFTASANDPCGYGLTYTFKWGDGSANTVTTNPNNVQHSYSSDGTYTVTVTAKSSTGLTSQSYPVQVTIGNMLTVDAYDYLAYIFDGVYYSLHPSVTVDGNSWGTAPVSKPVTATSHTLTLSSTVSDGFWGGGTAYFDFMEDQNGHGYTNGASVPVTSPLVIYAWYVT